MFNSLSPCHMPTIVLCPRKWIGSQESCFYGANRVIVIKDLFQQPHHHRWVQWSGKNKHVSVKASYFIFSQMDLQKRLWVHLYWGSNFRKSNENAEKCGRKLRKANKGDNKEQINVVGDRSSALLGLRRVFGIFLRTPLLLGLTQLLQFIHWRVIPFVELLASQHVLCWSRKLFQPQRQQQEKEMQRVFCGRIPR